MAGPISELAMVLGEIGWTMDEEFKIERPRGGYLDLIEGEDAIFDHILRGALRKNFIKNSMKNCKKMRVKKFEGLLQEGIDYEASVELSLIHI